MSWELAILPLRASQRDSDEPFYYLIESYGNCAKKKYDISFKIWIWIYEARISSLLKLFISGIDFQQIVCVLTKL